ncbi:MAG: glutamate decarboxylase [Firmicutes bacterium]|nr:glutamate decarboxylase [Bacillota bacterium]
MWTVVYIAPNRAIAESMKELLEKEGHLVMLRPVGVPHLGASGNVEILVPESEAEDAQDILTSTYGR